jgi:hypothetical protein
VIGVELIEIGPETTGMGDWVPKTLTVGVAVAVLGMTGLAALPADAAAQTRGVLQATATVVDTRQSEAALTRARAVGLRRMAFAPQPAPPAEPAVEILAARAGRELPERARRVVVTVSYLD